MDSDQKTELLSSHRRNSSNYGTGQGSESRPEERSDLNQTWLGTCWSFIQNYIIIPIQRLRGVNPEYESIRNAYIAKNRHTNTDDQPGLEEKISAYIHLDKSQTPAQLDDEKSPESSPASIEILRNQQPTKRHWTTRYMPRTRTMVGLCLLAEAAHIAYTFSNASDYTDEDIDTVLTQLSLGFMKVCFADLGRQNLAYINITTLIKWWHLLTPLGISLYDLLKRAFRSYWNPVGFNAHIHNNSLLTTYAPRNFFSNFLDSSFLYNINHNEHGDHDPILSWERISYISSMLAISGFANSILSTYQQRNMLAYISAHHGPGILIESEAAQRLSFNAAAFASALETIASPSNIAIIAATIGIPELINQIQNLHHFIQENDDFKIDQFSTSTANFIRHMNAPRSNSYYFKMLALNFIISIPNAISAISSFRGPTLFVENVLGSESHTLINLFGFPSCLSTFCVNQVALGTILDYVSTSFYTPYTLSWKRLIKIILTSVAAFFSSLSFAMLSSDSLAEFHIGPSCELAASIITSLVETLVFYYAIDSVTNSLKQIINVFRNRTDNPDLRALLLRKVEQLRSQLLANDQLNSLKSNLIKRLIHQPSYNITREEPYNYQNNDIANILNRINELPLQDETTMTRKEAITNLGMIGLSLAIPGIAGYLNVFRKHSGWGIGSTLFVLGYPSVGCLYAIGNISVARQFKLAWNKLLNCEYGWKEFLSFIVSLLIGFIGGSNSGGLCSQSGVELNSQAFAQILGWSGTAATSLINYHSPYSIIMPKLESAENRCRERNNTTAQNSRADDDKIRQFFDFLRTYVENASAREIEFLSESEEISSTWFNDEDNQVVSSFDQQQSSYSPNHSTLFSQSEIIVDLSKENDDSKDDSLAIGLL